LPSFRAVCLRRRAKSSGRWTVRRIQYEHNTEEKPTSRPPPR
jgi:hypothetical protein